MTLVELYKKCSDALKSRESDDIRLVTELGIEKTLKDTQNNEIQDFGEYLNYFSNTFTNQEQYMTEEARSHLRFIIYKRIIELLERENNLIKVKRYTSIKSSVEGNIKTRIFNMYHVVDEISINVISLIVYRYYENLIPENSFANKLDHDHASRFYTNYYPSYKKFIARKYELMQSHKYNKLLITDIVKYYDRVNIQVIEQILLRYIPFEKEDEEYKLIESYIDFLRTNCSNGLPQGPIFSHFLGSLLLYDLPIVFKDKFPGYKIDIYVDDIHVYYYSNGVDDLSSEIMHFLDQYLSKRLIRYDVEPYDNNEEKRLTFLSESKSSIVDLNVNNAKFILLSQELSAINELKTDYRNLEENDKASLKLSLRENLRELKDFVREYSPDNNDLKNIIGKQERFTKYRELLMVDDAVELKEAIIRIFEEYEVGLFDKSFSNYINAIKSNFLHMRKSLSEFMEFINTNILHRLEEYHENPHYPNLHDYYKSVCEYFYKVYEVYLKINNPSRVKVGSIELNLDNIYKMVNNLKRQLEAFNEYNEESIYVSCDLDLLETEEVNEIKFKEESMTYWRLNNLSDRLQIYFDMIFHTATNSHKNYVLPFNKKNRPLKLAEYRILQYLRTSHEDVNEKLDYILNILKDHRGDREFEYVDPDFFGIIRILLRAKCKGKELDNIIVAHHYVRDIWKNGAQDMPFYTLHNQEHSVELIRILSKIDEKTNGKLFSRMNSIENYVLFMSIYVHDLGMLFFSNKDFMDDVDCKFSRKTEAQVQTVFKEIEKNGQSYTRGRILREALDFHKMISFYRTEKTRAEHSYNSRRFSKEFDFIISDLKQVVVEVANNHYLDIDKMYTKEIWYRKNKIDVRYISVLLRVADSLDQSINRVSNNLYTYFNDYVEEMDSTSLAHWAKHMLVRNVRVQKSNIGSSKYKKNYEVILEFNSLPFTKSYGKSNIVVYHDHDIENKHLKHNRNGRKTRNLFDIFINYFFRYVISEMEVLNEYLEYESGISILIRYETTKNSGKKFLRYEKLLSDYLMNQTN